MFNNESKNNKNEIYIGENRKKQFHFSLMIFTLKLINFKKINIWMIKLKVFPELNH